MKHLPLLLLAGMLNILLLALIFTIAVLSFLTPGLELAIVAIFTTLLLLFSEVTLCIIGLLWWHANRFDVRFHRWKWRQTQRLERWLNHHLR